MSDADAVPLAPEDAARITEFARACKAAARAVVLYPAAHPAIGATLGRIVHLTSAAHLLRPLALEVLPDRLLIDGRAVARPDPAIAELATLLHAHLIGELIVHPGGDADAWRQFLLLLARSADTIRADGGIARVWAAMAHRHLTLREIDYAEALRERKAGEAAATWDAVIANCLQGDTVQLDEDAIREFLGIAADSEKLGALVTELETRADAAGGGLGAKTAALLRMLRGIVDAVATSAPERLEPVLRNMASAVGQLSPDTLMGLLTTAGDADEGPRLMHAVIGRMTDGTIAGFVARNVVRQASATDRLAQAFQTLVRDDQQRVRLLALAREDVAASPLGGTDGFGQVWGTVAEKLLTSYSDEPYVSPEYGRELSNARTQAIEVEQVGDDPPERISAWLGSVATSALRSLDLTLLLDLLRLETDEDRWETLMTPVVLQIEDLMLVGDFEAADQLLAVLVRESSDGATTARRQHAMIGIDALVGGALMRHVVAHLGTVDEPQFERIKSMSVSLGEVLVRPLAEALSIEERGRTRERLTSILLAFGTVGRRTVERLKKSQNAAVRRTAIQLMRKFGGAEALPELTELLDDSEPQVQREAVRAILYLASEPAYKVLEQALASGTARSRDAIMQALAGMRDERATPLLSYILRHMDHRRALSAPYLRAIEALGALRDPEGIPALAEALRKGDWWAPRRTRELRAAAAAALARVGSPEADRVLAEAARDGSRGVRAAVRAHLRAGAARQPPRGAAS
ncbi:MAG: HEAT repeat domain-containing protein [Acidobacteria bacterium]|nr:HEAT repeat domain-containing protein [Acidobacteriota bacterium]